MGASQIDGAQGDALQFLRANTQWAYSIYDIDPWSTPFDAVSLAASHAWASRIGIFVTDGHLMQAGRMGQRFTTIIRDVMPEWPETRHVKRWIYYNYPKALMALLARLVAPRFEIEDARICRSRGRSIANYAGLICVEVGASGCDNHRADNAVDPS